MTRTTLPSTPLPSTRSAVLRSAAALGAGAALTLLTTGVASAHVTAQPGTAAKGSYPKVAFRVSDESATAGTVKLEVTLPAEHPIASVRTSPLPGWTAQITKAPLNPPVERDRVTITQAVRTITWTAQPGTRIGPDEFLDFEVSIGALPDDVDQLVMPAVQTYDDGTVVSWNETQAPGAAEPEHPAPSLTLTAAAAEGGHSHGADRQPGGADAMAGTGASGGSGSASGSASASGSSGGGATTAAAAADNTARWLGGAGLLLGALGLGLGVGAVARIKSLVKSLGSRP